MTSLPPLRGRDRACLAVAQRAKAGGGNAQGAVAERAYRPPTSPMAYDSRFPSARDRGGASKSAQIRCYTLPFSMIRMRTRFVETEFSTPLSEFPAYLSSISMVVDDRAAVVRALTWAERKSPPRYDSARALFLRVLKGDLTFDEAVRQARQVPEPVQSRCAVEVLIASETFLRSQQPLPVDLFSQMSIRLPNDMELKVSPVWLRRAQPQRIMVLYFWETPLSDRQIRAAAAVLGRALQRYQPGYLNHPLEFILVSTPERSSNRLFRCLDWAAINAINDRELERFLQQLCDAWADYQCRGPRLFKRKRTPDLFR